MALSAKDISLTALNPTLWANTMQVPLRKSLVSEAVADTQFEALLKYGDAVTQPYMQDSVVTAYTPGEVFVSQGASAKEDTLNVDQFKISATYTDDINELQAKYGYPMDTIDDQAYQLKDTIDTDVFKQVSAATLHLAANASANEGGTVVTAGPLNLSAVSAIKLSTADSSTSALSPIELFARARKELRAKNVREAGDWVAVIDPDAAQIIEMTGAEKGFNVADATLRNGYAGPFMGFKVYVTNNLATHENGKLAYFGRSKRIGLVVQMPPRVRFKDDSYRLGTNIVTSIVYGTKVFTKNKERFIGALLTS